MKYVAAVWTQPLDRTLPYKSQRYLYKEEHVRFFLKHVSKMAPGWTPLIWTDLGAERVLDAARGAGIETSVRVDDISWFVAKYNLSGWWPQLMVSHPDYHDHDIINVGLDCLFLRPADELVALTGNRVTFGRPWRFMDRTPQAPIHNAFCYFPAGAPDQTLFEFFDRRADLAWKDRFDEILWARWLYRLDSWEDQIDCYPHGAIASWKCMSGYGGAVCGNHPAKSPADAYALCFHGKPKPWDVIKEQLPFWREIKEVTQ